ncbi:MAG TPA: hypothetical protein PLZ56_12320 [Anaerolineae bacterium]|nr:hypothetical protein [Anaerolineae bacterium]
MGINLTPKGWAAASPCGHACIICAGADVSSDYRAWALLAFRVADVERAIANTDAPLLLSGLTQYRDKLVERLEAAKAAL